jgi:prepilin-type processing-associated H-X9-DG protein
MYSGAVYNGVIVRTNWDASVSPGVPAGSTKPIGISDITDGTSNTIMLGEKMVGPECYRSEVPRCSGNGDTGGWAGTGWGWQTLRSTRWPPSVDTDDPVRGLGMAAGIDVETEAYGFGSAHPGSFNGAFADGSVHQINYNINRSIFNWLGHRSDGQTVLGSEF